jgi:hypothetical protein
VIDMDSMARSNPMNNPVNVKTLPAHYAGHSGAPAHALDDEDVSAREHLISASPVQAVAPAGHNAFVPLLLSTLALLVFFSFQAAQAYGQRQALLATHVAQQQTVDNAGRLRANLDALAADTQRMADAGNPNAGALVAELRRRGITINTAAAVVPATTGAAPEVPPPPGR